MRYNVKVLEMFKLGYLEKAMSKPKNHEMGGRSEDR